MEPDEIEPLTITLSDLDESGWSYEDTITVQPLHTVESAITINTEPYSDTRAKSKLPLQIHQKYGLKD